MRVLLALAMLSVCWCASGGDKKDEKIDAKKLIGKWGPDAPKDGRMFVMEFLKDGTLTISRTADGTEPKSDGSYKLDGNKLTVAMTADGKGVSDIRTITKLTDAVLVTTGDDATEFTMVRIKDKK